VLPAVIGWCQVTQVRKVEHIQQQIRELSASELAELREWVLEQDWTEWDTQIQRDQRDGKLEKLVSESTAEYESGKSRKL
jgi:hypothetical protein